MHVKKDVVQLKLLGGISHQPYICKEIKEQASLMLPCGRLSMRVLDRGCSKDLSDRFSPLQNIH